MLTLKNPFLMISQLQAIAAQADAERLSVLVDQFAAEFPDLYNLINDLAELPPGQAAKAVIERWPVLAVIRVYPDHEKLIELLQSEIKSRRSNERDKNPL